MESSPQAQVYEEVHGSSDKNHVVNFMSARTNKMDDKTTKTFSYNDGLNRDLQHHLISFFERPVLFTSGEWNPTSELLFSIPTVASILKKVPMYLDKTQNFKYFRGDLHVRVVVNNTPFQQGAMVISYDPAQTYGVFNEYGTGRVHAYSQTNRYHSILNLSESNSLEFVVPFVHTKESVDVSFNSSPNKGDPDIGVVQGSVLSTLRGETSGEKADFSVFVWFSKVSLMIPTIENPAPQNERQMKLDTEMIDKSVDVVNKAYGSVQKVTSKQQEEASSVTGIPLLDTAINFLPDVIKWFGFSKPASVDHIAIYKQDAFRYMGNADGIDTSANAGVFSDNAIAKVAKDNVEMDADEMSLDYLLHRYNFAYSFEYDKVDKQGTKILEISVGPWADDFKSTVTRNIRYSGNVEVPVNLKYVPTYSYISGFFQYWRGTMSYSFQAIKSNYQSGRLAVTWNPDPYSSSFVNYDAAGPYTQIWDLSQTSVFTFDVPFMRNVGYLPNLRTARVTSTGISTTDPTKVFEYSTVLSNKEFSRFAKKEQEGLYCNGYITVSVLNPLVVPSTCSSQVEILVFATLKDAQFAMPTSVPAFYPAQVVPEGDGGRPVYVDFSPVASASTSTLNQREAHYENINIKDDTVAFDPDPLMIGEKIVSLRPLIKRFHRVSHVKNLPNVNAGYLFLPQYLNSIVDTTVPFIAAEKDTTISIGAYDLILPMFGFSMGSVRFKVQTDALATFTMQPVQNRIAEPSLGADYDIYRFVMMCDDRSDAGSFGYKGASAFTYTNPNHVYEFQVPAYSFTPRRYNVIKKNPLSESSFLQYETYPAVKMNLVNDSESTFDVYRSVGDDFNCFCFRGAPLVIETAVYDKAVPQIQR